MIVSKGLAMKQKDEQGCQKDARPVNQHIRDLGAAKGNKELVEFVRNSIGKGGDHGEGKHAAQEFFGKEVEEKSNGKNREDKVFDDMRTLAFDEI